MEDILINNYNNEKNNKEITKSFIKEKLLLKINNNSNILIKKETNKYLKITSKKQLEKLNEKKKLKDIILINKNYEFNPYLNNGDIIISEELMNIIGFTYYINYLKNIKIIKNIIINPSLTIMKILKIKNDYKNNDCLMIIYYINNIPNYLKPIFPNILNSCEIKTRIFREFFSFMYKLRVEIKISSSIKIKLENLLPKLIFIKEKNFIKKKYIERIYKWKYTVKDKETSKKNKVNLSNNSRLIKTYSGNPNHNPFMLRYFLNKYYNISKSINFNKKENTILFKIITKIVYFRKHLIDFVNVKFSVNEIKNLIKNISEKRNTFMFKGIENIKTYDFDSEEIELISNYRFIFSKYYILSTSMIDSYNVFLRDNSDDLLDY